MVSEVGQDGDKYPVLTQKDGNTVYYSECTCVDKQVKIYSNTENEKFNKHDKGTELYWQMVFIALPASDADELQVHQRFLSGTAGNDLELTADTEGNYRS